MTTPHTTDPTELQGPFVVYCPRCFHGIDPHGTDPGGVCGVGGCECLMSPNGIAATLITVDIDDEMQARFVASWIVEQVRASGDFPPGLDLSLVDRSAAGIRQWAQARAVERAEREAREREFVEAAAKAICAEERTAADHVVQWGGLSEDGKEIYRRSARAVLVAAGVIEGER